MSEPLALSVEQLTVEFGGLIAVDDLSLQAPAGRITGLIGPNGAGKTTTFNACTGLNQPTYGRIVLGDHDASRDGAEERARRGLGRTFQRMELFDSVSVRENVALGLEARLAGRSPLRHLLCSSRDRTAIDRATDAAIELCGIADVAGQPVAGLSTGQRRLVELARAVAGDFGLLLLDEPSSGLDSEETSRFGDILKGLVAERGTSVLLVEHDMSLVMSCCEHIYVIDFGQLIFEGTPAQTQASSVVRNAYLGDEL